MPDKALSVDLLCDADATEDDQVLYDESEILDLANSMDDCDIMEVHCWHQLPNKFLVHDGRGNAILCDSREGAERIAESIQSKEDESP